MVTLKAYLQLTLTNRWTASLETHLTARRQLLGVQPSILKARKEAPRPLQCLHSRYRLGETETAGPYPRRLDWLESPYCRLCQGAKEDIPHLLLSCPGTRPYLDAHGPTARQLRCDDLEAITATAVFDEWLRTVLPSTHTPPDFHIRQDLALLRRPAPDPLPPGPQQRRRIAAPSNTLV